MPEPITCFLCGADAECRQVHNHFINEYSCRNCGVYRINRVSEAIIVDTLDQEAKNKLSSLTNEQSLSGLPPYLLLHEPVIVHVEGSYAITVEELLRKWPNTVKERLARTLCNLGRLYPIGGTTLNLENLRQALLFGRNEQERMYNWATLAKEGFLYRVDANTALISPLGWQKIEQHLKGSSSPGNPVFVAMWFGEEPGEWNKGRMDLVYRNGLEPGINAAGFKATRVDLEHHNEYIMDKVFALIRSAPFVVADFTGHRNGVYFEAAFAKGLGMPVIPSCHKSQFNKAHFDTTQLNHVIWDTETVLKELLTNRILGTIGQRPFDPASLTRKAD